MRRGLTISVLILWALFVLNIATGQVLPQGERKVSQPSAYSPFEAPRWEHPSNWAPLCDTYFGYQIPDTMHHFISTGNKRFRLLERIMRYSKRRPNVSSLRYDSFSQNMNTSDSVETGWVKHYGSGRAPAYDVTTDVATDSLGNVYITGYSSSQPFGMDYITIKYSPSGEELWTARYNGQGNRDDFALALCVDALGHVYVTGESKGISSGTDYATLKYSSDGILQWTALYNGDANGEEGPLDIAVDDRGNVYVTGWSEGSGGRSDCATVKYDSEGAEQWVARYDGPHNLGDGAFALAVDTSGNVYVTGWSDGIGAYSDYATIKYTTHGVQEWIVRYSGFGNSSDVAHAIGLDDSGNVYVTGISGLLPDYDYATVKYNSAGTEQWVVRYDGPGYAYDEATALAVDDSGNIYVTGYSQGAGTEYDYATIKYNGEGTELWVARYDGPAHSYDRAYDVAVDQSGNVYVTGDSPGAGTNSDCATIKYNASGVQEWAVRYQSTARECGVFVGLSIGGSGHICVAGEGWNILTDFDCVTIQYDKEGREQWMNHYDGPGNSHDRARDLVIHPSGDIIVTGTSWSPATGSDYTTVKYSPTGVEQWISFYNGPGNVDDEAQALTVDTEGNIYVTGYSGKHGTDYGYTTVSYNSTGEQQWVAHYDGPQNSNSFATTVAVDDFGNVYVTGTCEYPGEGSDYITIKYDSEGREQWIASYNDSHNSENSARALVIDGSGNVYVTGESGFPDSDYDYITVKYNSEGEEQWAARYSGPADVFDGPRDIAIDISDNIYVTGVSEGFGTGADFATVKYDSDGTEQWVVRYNSSHNLGDMATALAVDATGNICVTGSSQSKGGGYDYVTIQYNPDGVEQWVARYNGTGNFDDVVKDMALDTSGNVFVTGSSYGTYHAPDFATIQYNQAGEEQWVARYNGPGDGQDEALALAVDHSHNVYVAGYSVGPHWTVFTTIQYSHTPVPDQVRGDVNGDGNVNVLDVVDIIRHIVGIESLENEAVWRADCNGDGEVNGLDVMGIVNVILGIGQCEP